MSEGKYLSYRTIKLYLHITQYSMMFLKAYNINLPYWPLSFLKVSGLHNNYIVTYIMTLFFTNKSSWFAIKVIHCKSSKWGRSRLLAARERGTILIQWSSHKFGFEFSNSHSKNIIWPVVCYSFTKTKEV